MTHNIKRGTNARVHGQNNIQKQHPSKDITMAYPIHRLSQPTLVPEWEGDMRRVEFPASNAVHWAARHDLLWNGAEQTNHHYYDILLCMMSFHEILFVPDICLICVISYHDTWHDILLSLISSLHIFVTVAHQQSFPWNMLKRTDTRMKRKRLLIQPLRSLGPIDQATPELTGWLTKKVWYCHNCHEIFGEIGL